MAFLAASSLRALKEQARRRLGAVVSRLLLQHLVLPKPAASVGSLSPSGVNE